VRSAPRLAAPNSHVVLQSRIVEHSSNYTSPAFLVPKGDGNFHLVILVDFVPQNENLVRDSSPLPYPESTFDCFWSVTDFSLPDTNSACYGVSLSPSSRLYTLCGLYEFVKIPVGVVSAGMFPGASVSDSCLMTLATC